jgi:sterol desaturase/sphingolipid hydroxylase (fatty acid hydroxylase superfamily)
MTTAAVSAPAASRLLPRTLGGAARMFWSVSPSPWIVLGAVLATAAARLALGAFSWIDVAVAAVLIASQPFQEWLIHKFEHVRPPKVLGRTMDLALMRMHRLHHQDPSNLPLIFIPKMAILSMFLLDAVIFFAVLPARHAVTGLFVASTIGLVYEWTHFLIHTSYAPRSAFYRGLWRLHRLHHYKNEDYWFGVTARLGDRVLGTDPDPKDVAVSPTARTLGVSGQEGP